MDEHDQHDDHDTTNEALWLASLSRAMEVRPAPMPTPGPDAVVVRVGSVAVNPIDAITGPFRRLVTPWVRYPTVLGSDVAGVVVQVGADVTTVGVGDRVLAFAAGQERPRNTPAEGGFQRFTTVLERVCTPIPDAIGFDAAATSPLGLSTAAAGLFEADQLGLPYPGSRGSSERDGVVLVWGASTSVGCNAVQLARGSGFTVIATAGPRNADLVRSLGAESVHDYRASDVDAAILRALDGRPLVGTVAIGSGSLGHAIRIARRAPGSKRIASVYPDPVTRVRSLLARTVGLRVSSIWGGTPVVSEVGPAVFQRFLPAALAEGRFRPAPEPTVVGSGLDAIPGALERLRAGVSATKLVVRVGGGAV